MVGKENDGGHQAETGLTVLTGSEVPESPIPTPRDTNVKASKSKGRGEGLFTGVR